MEYNFNKVQDANFCCLYAFLDNILEEYNKIIGNNHKSLSIIAGSDLSQEIFTELLYYSDDYDLNLTFGIVEIDNYDYDEEYIISLSSDKTICIEKMVTENGIFLSTMSDIVFLHEDCDYRSLQAVDYGENNIVIFGFDYDGSKLPRS